MKKGSKTSKVKSRASAFLCAVFAAVIAGATVFSACADSAKSFNHKSPAEDTAQTTTQEASNSLRFVVNGDFEKNWNNAVKVSKEKGKQVWFILGADWIAPTAEANHPFGADADGFSYGRITVPAGADIVLDLNGHTINRGLTTYTQLGSVLYIDGGKLTLEDGAGGGTVTGGWTGEYQNWHPTEGNYDYGGGVIMKSGEFTLNGGSITGNYADCAGGIYILDGKFIMNGGSVTNNKADCTGGGIEIDNDGGHEINGGVISYNTVTGLNVSSTSNVTGGGGVYLFDGGVLTMNGGTITHNDSQLYGGGVLLKRNTYFTFNDGEISYNSAVTNEGAICMDTPSTLEMNGGIITGNTQPRGATISPSSSSFLKIGGPVKIYNNYNTGTTTQANLTVSGVSQLKITGPLVTEKGAAFIGISTSLASGKTLTSGLKTNGNVFNYSADMAIWFFSDNDTRRVQQNSTKTELIVTSGSTTFFNVDWQYQLDNSGDWISSNGANEINLTYGQKVTAVRTVTVDTNETAHDWQDGGVTPTHMYMIYCDASGDTDQNAFTSIENVGKYSFVTASDGQFWTDYWASHGNPHGVIFSSTFTINIKPKEIKVNLIDKGGEYGTAIKDLYAEEDVLDGDGQPTGAKVKPQIDPSTPLVGADASLNLSDLVTLTTEATGTSDLGVYTIKGAAKSNEVNKNYKYTFKTASYTVSAATVTAQFSGSKTYNGSAQNDATVTFTYPTGFAGTRMTSADYTVTYPTAGCLNAKKYTKDDLGITLGKTANAKRFVIADNGISGEYEIKKAKLICTADAKTIGYGDPAPTYTATFTGFVGTDTQATVIKGSLTYTCSYTQTSAAGEYDITPSGATADNYEIEFKKGKLTVGTGTVAKPSLSVTEVTYDGTEKAFAVTGFNSAAIKTVTLSDSTNFTWDAANAKIKATKAGKCTVTFTLDTDKYTWADGTLTPHTVDIEVKPKPLVFSFTPAGGDSWKWEHGAEGSIAYAQTETLPAGNNIAYYFCYYPANDSSKEVKVDGTSIDVSKLNAGSYVAEVKLVAAGETGYSTDNKNYVINADSKATQSFKIDAGGADVSGLEWKFTRGDDPAAALFADGKQAELRYEKKDGEAVIYRVGLPEIPASHNYLSIDTTKFDGGVKTETDDGTPVTDCTAPGTYKTTVALKTTSNYLFDDPTAVDNISADKMSGEVTITWTIGKGKVDISKVKVQYGWINDDTGEIDWFDFDEKNPPVFNPDSPVSIRIKPETYPDGITKAEITANDYAGDRDVPGTLAANVKYTLDPNYVYIKDGTTAEISGTFTDNVSITLAKKKIKINWTLDTVKDADGNEVLDENGVPYQIYVLDFGSDPDNLKKFVKYEYLKADPSDTTDPTLATPVPEQASGTTTNAQLDYLIDVDGAGKFNGGSSTKSIPIFVKAVLDTTVAGYEYYEFEIPDGSNADYQFTKLGQKKNAVKVEQLKDKLVYGTAVASPDELYSLTKNGSKYSESVYNAVIYKGTDDTNAVAVKDFDFSTAGVGVYTVKFSLKPSVADSDALGKTSLTLEITKKPIEVPSVTGRIEFNGTELAFADYLDAKYKEYLDAGIISAVGGRTGARNVSANGAYVATIEIVNENYMWKLPEEAEATPSKSIARVSLAADEASSSITLNAAASEASYSWNVAPFRLTSDIVTTSGKNGAAINLTKLPEWARQLITDGRLTAGLKYYVDENCTEEAATDDSGNYILEKKMSYYVKPVIGAGENGDDSGNFTFSTDDSVTNTPEKAVTYKVPQSGAAAALGNIKDFVTKTWLGLPVWAWMAIGLAVLILLIIIIAVAVKRSKNKAAREEKKAAKEAERARLESQREIEKMKAEAEAAKAKAQAEAEIAKIRAQAQAAMPQVQPAQAMPQMPQMPQAMPQQQPVQAMPDVRQYPQQANVASRQYAPQPTADGGAIARIEAEIAAMRAEHRTEREFAAMRAEQRADRELNAIKTELEISKLRAEQRGYSSSQSDKSSFEQSLNNPDMLMIGQLAVAIWKSMKEGASLPSLQQQPAEQPDQTVKEEVSQPVSAAYPPDAVITTTTTVDTTRSAKTNLRGRDNQRDAAGFADIDGFYDSYEE
jgi:F0F1-type ATP synthase membrane subunit b/b'